MISHEKDSESTLIINKKHSITIKHNYERFSCPKKYRF